VINSTVINSIVTDYAEGQWWLFVGQVSSSYRYLGHNPIIQAGYLRL